MTTNFLLSISLVIFFTGVNQDLYAHSGGTDSYGCHTNHSTGVYHCHNPKGYRSNASSKSRAPASVKKHHNHIKKSVSHSQNKKTIANK